MPKHEIRYSIPAAEVVNSDVEFGVWSDGKLLGQLHISRGSLDWTPGHSPLCYTMSWERFAEVFEQHGRRTR